VDDILIICDQRKTNIEETLTELNEQEPIIKFTMEKELHNYINFLDHSVHRREKESLQYTETPFSHIIIPTTPAIHTNIEYEVPAI
jgi:hypothetical protein